MTIYIVSKQGVEWNELHSAHQAERDHMGKGLSHADPLVVALRS